MTIIEENLIKKEKGEWVKLKWIRQKASVRDLLLGKGKQVFPREKSEIR